jgi:tetratricopeptide (TPR) repeat protein
MKKVILTTLLSLFILFTHAQGSEQAQQLVSEGVDLHDKGDYQGALDKYDAAIKIDEQYFNAWYEKTLTLYYMNKKKDCASLCKSVIKKFPDNPGLGAVYMQYGSALDDMGKPNDALEMYDEAISKYPGLFLLHFNKGLTLQKLNRFEEALLEYQRSLQIKPLHSSSNLYTGLLLQDKNRIPALLAYATFLAIEPKTDRSKEALTRAEKIAGANVKKEGNNTTIFLDPSLLGGAKNKKQENDFSTIEMIFSLTAAAESKELDSLAKTPAEKMSFRLQMLINSLDESKKEGKGFYWDHYVSFFVEMKEKNLVGTLAHLMYAKSNDEEDNKWLEQNESAIEGFYDWIQGYKWKK